MSHFIALGECMIELSGAGDDLWRMGIAGDTLNTAWYARAGFGAQWRVSFATVIGEDAFSARVPAFLAQNGLATDRLMRDAQRSIGLYAISLAQGERSFSYWRGQSAAKTLADDPARLARMTAGASVVHLSGITLAILPPEARAHLGALRAQGVRGVFDPNIRPRLWEDPQTARTQITLAARAADIVLPSFDDEAALFGCDTPAQTRARYAALGAATVVVKNGTGPMCLAHGGQSYDLDPLEQVRPIDTTGAGDSFNGAFIAALMQGASVLSAVHAGHKMAARVVLHRGALIPMAALQS